MPRPSPNAAAFAQHDRGRAGVADREPDVGRRHDLFGQPADGLADLLAEHRAAELVEHARASVRPSPAPRRACAAPIALTTLSATGSTSRCHDRHARLDPLGAAPRGDGGRRRREVGRLVEPVLGQAGRRREPGRVAGVGRPVGRLRHDLPGEVAGELPVDGALVRREHPLDLAEHRPAGSRHVAARRGRRTSARTACRRRGSAGRGPVLLVVVGRVRRGDVCHPSQRTGLPSAEGATRIAARLRTVSRVTRSRPAARAPRRPTCRRRGLSAPCATPRPAGSRSSSASSATTTAGKDVVGARLQRAPDRRGRRCARSAEKVVVRARRRGVAAVHRVGELADRRHRRHRRRRVRRIAARRSTPAAAADRRDQEADADLEAPGLRRRHRRVGRHAVSGSRGRLPEANVRWMTTSAETRRTSDGSDRCAGGAMEVLWWLVPPLAATCAGHGLGGLARAVERDDVRATTPTRRWLGWSRRSHADSAHGPPGRVAVASGRAVARRRHPRCGAPPRRPSDARRR